MQIKKYNTFLQEKEKLHQETGFKVLRKSIHPLLFDFQKDCVIWALKKGKSCLFEDCGLGKTLQQLEWARHVLKKTNKPILIIAPLAVSFQTKEEGKKIDLPVNICETNEDVIFGINITNFEKLHKFDTSVFGGIVLDESSILKNATGIIRNQIIDSFKTTQYKLACTATPSPNDYMELGNHAEFLGIMSFSEMLSMFFVNDSKDVGKWRLKKYAHEQDFWRWICSWAIMISSPEDLGYTNQKGFKLPKLNYIEHILPNTSKPTFGFFHIAAKTLNERRQVRKDTLVERCNKAAKIINSTDDQWLIWCGLNSESILLTELIDDAKEVAGSTKMDLRASRMLGFAANKVKRLVTKPSIAGFGMNWQNCNKIMFVGLNDSWEQFYQAVRRSWRFGQLKDVDVYIIINEMEGAVLKNIKRKDSQAVYMIKQMTSMLKKYQKGIKKTKTLITITLPEWEQKN